MPKGTALKDLEFSITLNDAGLIETSSKSFSAILQWKDVDVFRRPLSFLFPPDAHGRVDRLVASKTIMENVVFPSVPVRFKPGGFINFDMKMKEMSAGKRHLEFYKPGGASVNKNESSQSNTDMYSFFNFVERLLDSPFDGDLDMTMIEVEALRDEMLSEEEKKAVRNEVEENLKTHAVGGELGQLDEASYGLIVSGGFDEEAFEAELVKVAENLDIDPALMGIRSANVTIDDRDLEPETLRTALSHSRGLFVGEVEGDMAALESLTAVVDGVNHNRNLVLDAIKKYQFRISERLMMDNVASISVAALQQGKVNIDGRLRLPDEIIVLPDHPDIALEHDLAQLDEFSRVRAHRKAEDQDRPDFYELCRSCLVQDAFLGGLKDILDRHSLPAEKLGFRLKGMPPSKRGGPHWQAAKSLIEAGHPVWLDRFGDAVTDPSLYDFLQGGYVELPAEILSRLSNHFDGADIMSALIEKWQANSVGVLMVDLKNIKLKTLAQEMGVRLSVLDSP